MNRLLSVIVFFLTLLAGIVTAQDGGKSDNNAGNIIRTKSDKAPVSREITVKIKKCISDLASADVVVRDAAEHELLQIGRPAIPELNRASHSANKNVSDAIVRILDAVKRIPSDEDMMKLADGLSDIIIRQCGKKSASQEHLDEKVRVLLREFACRFAPSEKIRTYQTADKKTLTINLGADSDSRQSGAGVVIAAVTRWVVAIGGQGWENKAGSASSADEQKTECQPGDASAEAPDGIAVALAGDGAVVRAEKGTDAGGCGANAKAVSPVYGLALCGFDRSKSNSPPLNGKAEGSGSIENALKFLRPDKTK